MSSTTVGNTATAPRLKRALGLWDLVLYGIIVIQPTAPMPAFGAFSNAGKGHVVTAVLIAMVAMIFTAISYGRMARVYPSAGSAYTYVGRELHPSLGFVTGWSMTMDYILNPLICTIWCGRAMADLVPEVPVPIWFVAFAVLFTVMNLRGVETSARINQALCAAMGLVILVFFVATVRYILHLPPQGAQFFTLPFYNPKTFSPGVVFHGTSLAVLTYIGFDAISTLSEEVHNPKRNILLATVLVCVATGVLASLEVYGAQLLRPETVAQIGQNQIGDIPLRIMKTAMPELSNDVDLFPGVRCGHGLANVINMQPGTNGRSAGTMTWAGLFNSYYWIDPHKRVTGVILTQILPFADPHAVRLYGEFERAVYDAVTSA